MNMQELQMQLKGADENYEHAKQAVEKARYELETAPAARLDAGRRIGELRARITATKNGETA